MSELVRERERGREERRDGDCGLRIADRDIVTVS